MLSEADRLDRSWRIKTGMSRLFLHNKKKKKRAGNVRKSGNRSMEWMDFDDDMEEYEDEWDGETDEYEDDEFDEYESDDDYDEIEEDETEAAYDEDEYAEDYEDDEDDGPAPGNSW